MHIIYLNSSSLINWYYLLNCTKLKLYCKVALFLGVSSNNLPGYDHKEVKTEDKTRIYNARGTKKVKEEDILFNLQLYDIRGHLPNISSQIETDKSNFEKDDKSTKAVTQVKKYKKRSKARKISNFNCNICEIGFLKENILGKHMLMKHNVPLVCSICKETFSEGRLFLEHMKDKSHMILIWPCETCNTTFKSKTALRNHNSWKHENTEKIPCKYCGVFVQGMKWHIKNRHENSIEKCNLCDFQTRRKSSMKNHIRALHTGTNLKTCEVCGVLRKDLAMHLERTKCGGDKGITERKSETCDECGKPFATKDSLNKHITRVHRKIKNRQCDQCDYSTYSGFNLKLHISKMHTGVELEKDKCSDCLQEVYNLPYHVKIYHQGNQ